MIKKLEKYHRWLFTGLTMGLVSSSAYFLLPIADSRLNINIGANIKGGLDSQGSLPQVEVAEPLVDRSLVTLDNLGDYRLGDLLGTASTSFKGSSASRIKNITLGAAQVSGTIIAPGEEFSLVEEIGYVNKEEGYAEEFVIKDGQSIKEYGGGLCQIATTVFRATLDSGLPITERRNHSYVVGYYGPGLDATIYGPHPDFRFVNDTDNYVVVKSYVEDHYLVFEFYGEADGRVATISEPVISDEIEPPLAKYISTTELAPNDIHCVERERTGLTTNVTYSVTYPDGEEKSEDFKSVYQPWQKVCYVGTIR